MSLVVIDYKSGGNLFSLFNSLEAVDAKFEVTSKPEEVLKAQKIIFPGVGSFTAAMQKLEQLELKQAIQEKVKESVPFLGICVGMQVLFEHGEEGSKTDIHQGLGIIPGSINKLEKKAGFKIPHMGWNQTKYSPQNPLFKGIEDDYFYFVHSYAYNFNANEKILEKYPKAQFTKTTHSEEFLSAFWNGENLFSTQFHPEKSAKQGLKLLKNFIDLDH
jgi:glutamine amidotransferase